jgi:hypothetical protein
MLFIINWLPQFIIEVILFHFILIVIHVFLLIKTKGIIFGEFDFKNSKHPCIEVKKLFQSTRKNTIQLKIQKFNPFLIDSIQLQIFQEKRQNLINHIQFILY